VVSFTPRPLYPGKIASDIHWIAGWVGSRTGLDAVVKRKIPNPSGTRTPNHPAHEFFKMKKLQEDEENGTDS
jgi:hypothetical protein